MPAAKAATESRSRRSRCRTSSVAACRRGEVPGDDLARGDVPDGQDDVGPGDGKTAGGLDTDARRRSGDDGDATGEVSRPRNVLGRRFAAETGRRQPKFFGAVERSSMPVPTSPSQVYRAMACCSCRPPPTSGGMTWNVDTTRRAADRHVLAVLGLQDTRHALALGNEGAEPGRIDDTCGDERPVTFEDVALVVRVLAVVAGWVRDIGEPAATREQRRPARRGHATWPPGECSVGGSGSRRR